MRSQPFAIPELLFFIFAVPLVLGLIPRNRFYGIRTSKTLSDERVWYTVNRFAAVAIMIGSVVYGVVAVLVPYEPSASDNFVEFGIHLVAFVVPLLISLSLVIWYSKRL